MASTTAPRALLLRPARRLATLSPVTRRAPFVARPISTTCARAQVKTPDAGGSSSVAGEMGVGELEGAKFRIEPLRRVGEDDQTMRARLTCTSTPLPLPPVPST